MDLMIIELIIIEAQYHRAHTCHHGVLLIDCPISGEPEQLSAPTGLKRPSIKDIPKRA